MKMSSAPGVWRVDSEARVDIERFLGGMFRTGALEVTLPGGRRLTLGDGSEPHLAVRLSGATTLARIMAKPSLGVGEAYMDHRLEFERGTIRDLIDLTGRNQGAPVAYGKPGLMKRLWTALTDEHNARRAARRNVHHHYDLSVELYRAFLDEDLQYSCAYFARDDMTLEEAQVAKKRHIAAKLALADGQRVLDIGCGWGGMALSVAQAAKVEVLGITLSDEQLATAQARSQALGLADRCAFQLTDYRDVTGKFDRIVSVGMFEHVGRPNYQAFFDTVAERLTDDGVALIHSIGRYSGPSTTDPFTAKYIFPGGYIPAVSEVIPAVERAGLVVTDVEILRRHYAKTLRCWYDRFQDRRAQMAQLYDERFCRMWEFYLAGAEMGFTWGDHMNFQLQVAKRNDALPLTRDYMAEAERALMDPREGANDQRLETMRASGD
ncbi:MAG: cyclopropane-fatty-acyl-phospholipid synthase family protein [Caulobacteraceae bacterium]|jgi:cyclopropane-fatty-acyl-phospholipid synthase